MSKIPPDRVLHFAGGSVAAALGVLANSSVRLHQCLKHLVRDHRHDRVAKHLHSVHPIS